MSGNIPSVSAKSTSEASLGSSVDKTSYLPFDIETFLNEGVMVPTSTSNPLPFDIHVYLDEGVIVPTGAGAGSTSSAIDGGLGADITAPAVSAPAGASSSAAPTTTPASAPTSQPGAYPQNGMGGPTGPDSTLQSHLDPWQTGGGANAGLSSSEDIPVAVPAESSNPVNQATPVQNTGAGSGASSGGAGAYIAGGAAGGALIGGAVAGGVAGSAAAGSAGAASTAAATAGSSNQNTNNNPTLSASSYKIITAHGSSLSANPSTGKISWSPDSGTSVFLFNENDMIQIQGNQVTSVNGQTPSSPINIGISDMQPLLDAGLENAIQSLPGDPSSSTQASASNPTVSTKTDDVNTALSLYSYLVGTGMSTQMAAEKAVNYLNGMSA